MGISELERVDASDYASQARLDSEFDLCFSANVDNFELESCGVVCNNLQFLYA